MRRPYGTGSEFSAAVANPARASLPSRRGAVGDHVGGGSAAADPRPSPGGDMRGHPQSRIRRHGMRVHSARFPAGLCGNALPGKLEFVIPADDRDIGFGIGACPRGVPGRPATELSGQRDAGAVREHQQNDKPLLSL